MLLLPLYVTYQGYLSEVDLKYGDRDITSGSLVFRCSKDNEASGEPLPEHIYTPKLKFILKIINISESVHQLRTKGAYTVMGCPLPLVIAKIK